MTYTKTGMAEISSTPKVVTDPRFRSRVRDLLVELPNSVPGLGLKVTGAENVVMVYPRAGRAISTIDDLLSLRWYSVRAGEYYDHLDFTELPPDEVRTFLEGFRTA